MNDHDRFLEMLRAEGRIEPPRDDSPELRRLHRSMRERIARRPDRFSARLAFAASLSVFAMAAFLMYSTTTTQAPAGQPIAVASGAAALSGDDAADDKLLRAVRSCRSAPDMGGLRSTFSAGIEIATSSTHPFADSPATANSAAEKGARS